MYVCINEEEEEEEDENHRVAADLHFEKWRQQLV